LFQRKELSYEEVEMVLVGNHGPFTWGKNADKAVYNSKVLKPSQKWHISPDKSILMHLA
jgi:ribulose-5-phosphate 4-epimerase/fuculose-1-phosphate aldolase